MYIVCIYIHIYNKTVKMYMYRDSKTFIPNFLLSKFWKNSLKLNQPQFPCLFLHYSLAVNLPHLFAYWFYV